MPDDQTPPISQDVINAMLPVTGQSSEVAQQPAPIRFEDLSQLLGGQQKTQTAQTQAAPAVVLGDVDAKTQSSLASMQPDFRDRATQWLQAMRDNGYNPVIHFGYRSPEEQQTLYQKYLAGGNKAVAPPMSYHTYGRAFDWVNQGQNGELQWNNDKAYEFGTSLAKQFNLTGISGDNDHIQDANYKSWRDLPRSEYGNVRQLTARK
jgi:LAS superfamily LD-carboxypeptidase LdcB